MFDISLPALLAQLLVGLINGCFYAILSMGLAIIFGLLNIVNFTHGAQFMMAAFLAWIGFTQLPQLLGPGVQINFWAALILAPLLVGAVGVVIEKTLLKRLYHLDHLYGLLLTFGIALMMEGGFRYFYGISGVGYEPPEILQGGFDLGFMFLPCVPRFRAVAVSLVLCLATVWVPDREARGWARCCAPATENPTIAAVRSASTCRC